MGGNVAKSLTKGELRALKHEEKKERDEKQADLLMAFSDDLSGTLGQIAEQCGVSRDTAVALARKMRAKGILLSRAMGEASRNEIKDLFEHRSWEILSSISPQDIAEAGLRDKLVAAGIAIDKSSMLSGQPTQIFSMPQLENLDVLASHIIKEMDRRGQEMSVNDDSQQVKLQPRVVSGMRGDATNGYTSPSDEPNHRGKPQEKVQ